MAGRVHGSGGDEALPGPSPALSPPPSPTALAEGNTYRELDLDDTGGQFQSIQKQVQMLQKMLPKIEDAGQRAGLLQHFAPKIEQ